jgi:hypothetical protein
MKRFKTKHAYHDARIRWFRFVGANLELGVDLCGCCNPTPGSAVVSLLGVRNRAAVGLALEASQAANLGCGYVAEIVGVFRHAERGYLLDLSMTAGLHVDADGFHEA